MPDVAQYPAELAVKVARVKAVLGANIPKDLDVKVVQSPELINYRHKVKVSMQPCDMRNGIKYVTFDSQTLDWVEVDQLPLASKRINTLMRDLKQAMREDAIMRNEAFMAELLSNTAGDALCCLMYHRPLLQDQDARMAARLASVVRGESCGKAAVVLRAKGQRMVARGCKDYLVQSNELRSQTFPQHLLENNFIQSNLKLNREMQRWVLEQSQSICDSFDGRPVDLLELFCGNGNFTLPASLCFRRVVATEQSHDLTAAAVRCAEEAHVENVRHIKMKASEVASSPLQVEPGDDPYDFQAILVDPPRAGLDDKTLELLRRHRHNLYFSCNVETLARDIQALQSTHRVVDLCIFDQFPWTDHVEVAARLEAVR